MHWILGAVGWLFGILAGGCWGSMLGSTWAAAGRDVKAGGFGMGRIKGRRQGAFYGRGGAIDGAGSLFAGCAFAAIAFASFAVAHSSVITIGSSAALGLVFMVACAIHEGRKEL